MENFSKNKEGRKRGRPAGMVKEAVEMMKQRPELNRLSNRQLYNEYYGRIGIGALYNKNFEPIDSVFTFLFTKEPYKEKRVILMELGKLITQYSADYAQAAARVICEHKMKTGEAVGYLKSLRGLGKKKVNGIIAKINTLIFSSYLTDTEYMELIQKLERLVSVHCQRIIDKKEGANA